MTDEEKEAFLAGYEAALNDVFECCGCGGKNGQDKAMTEYEQRKNGETS